MIKDEKDTTIFFRENEQNKIDFKIRLGEDRMTTSIFFRACLRAYLDRQEDFMTFIEGVQAKRLKNMSKAEIAKRKAEKRQAKEIEADFSLDEEDIENIFDIIGSKHPEI